MSFIYSQALVAASSLGRCSDTDASAPLSGSPMPQAYSSPDRMTALSRLSRFGMTFAPLTADRGEALLTSWLAGFRAKTSALPGKAQASPESDPGCGPTWRGSLAKFDPVSSSWKTVQLCLLGDSELSSVTWPRSGMTAGGQCWELPMSERRISATGSGLLPPDQELTQKSYFWRTPTAHEWKNTGHATQIYLSDQVRPSQVKNPTKAAAMWPTPLAQDAKHSGYAKSGPGMADKLSYAVVRYQTPVSRMYKDNGSNPSELERNSPTLAMQAGGVLSPTWVEWLMGWPLGWTDLKPLATDKFPFVPQLHSSSLPPVLSEAA